MFIFQIPSRSLGDSCTSVTKTTGTTVTIPLNVDIIWYVTTLMEMTLIMLFVSSAYKSHSYL